MRERSGEENVLRTGTGRNGTGTGNRVIFRSRPRFPEPSFSKFNTTTKKIAKETRNIPPLLRKHETQDMASTEVVEADGAGGFASLGGYSRTKPSIHDHTAGGFPTSFPSDVPTMSPTDSPTGSPI